MSELVALVIASIVGVLLLLGAIGMMIVAIIRLTVGALRGDSTKVVADDARLIQDLHRGLARMESRVETLETILLERGERVEGGNRERMS